MLSYIWNTVQDFISTIKIHNLAIYIENMLYHKADLKTSNPIFGLIKFICLSVI